MKQEKLLQIGWCITNAVLMIDIFLKGLWFGSLFFPTWIFMLFFSAYVKWKTSKGLAVFYIALAVAVIILMTWAHLTFPASPRPSHI